MPDLPLPGTTIDGFRLGECIHAGAQAWIYRIVGGVAGFPAVMKVPRFGPGEPSENLISFETEAAILPALSGPHVPRFVAVGRPHEDALSRPRMDRGRDARKSAEARQASCRRTSRGSARRSPTPSTALHLQDAIHFDLKPDNLIVKPDGEVALIDFGLAHHARYPDLLAEEKRFAAGSAPYVSPEQVQGRRSDKRSDIFSLGVILYEMATGKLPFGVPQTMAGLRDRLWLDPVPPREHASAIPPWLQEIILRCLEPRADERYQSAAHVAFDLRNPEQVGLTARAAKSGRAAFMSQARRWWRARREQSRLAPRARRAGAGSAGHSGGRGHDASGGCAATRPAARGIAGALAFRRVQAHLRVGGSGRAGERWRRRRRGRLRHSPRAPRAVAPLGGAASLAAAAAVDARDRVAAAGERAARFRPPQQRRSDRPRSAQPDAARVGMVALGGLQRHRERAMQRLCGSHSRARVGAGDRRGRVAVDRRRPD